MIKQKFPKFILALFLISSNVMAQWQIKLDRNLNWFQILPTGNILLANNEGVSAIDENTGTTVFSLNNITSLTEEEFQIIPNTPFGMITRGQGKLEIKFIFNFITGKVLFDSKKENILVGKQYIIRNSGDFLMQGLKGSESVFFLVDAETGTIRWELKDFLGKSIFAEVIDGTPLKNEDGNIIFPTTGGMTGGAIYCLSSSNGKLLWKSELPKLKGAQSATTTDSKLAVSLLEKDKFIFMKGQAIMAYQIASGKQLWNEPAKQRGLPDLAIYDPFGLIISSAIDQKNTLFKPTMAMYDYNSGKELWNEQVKLKGTVNKYNYCAKGLIISMDNGKGSCFINIVDLGTGTFVFNDHYKVNGIVNEMQLCGTSLYIRTDLEEDFVSLESNKSILEKNISTKQDKPLLNLQQDNFSYTYNPSTDLLSVSDLGLTTQKVLCPDKISFSGNETPTRIEKLGDVIVLSSSQTVAGYDKSGKEIFKTYIPAPGIPGWKKAIHAADAILQMGEAMRYAEAEAKLKELGKNSNTPEGRALADGFAQIANKGTNAYLAAANKNMDRINKRFKASASGNEVQFILGKLESKDYGLIGISKLNGQKKSEINLGKDKEPKYLLDDISKTIYYLKDGVLKSIKY